MKLLLPFFAAAASGIVLRPAAATRTGSSPAMSAALPKAKTGVEALLQESREADGRGTIVAVLDTGCDLEAAGLLTTSDGLPKYVDFLDCTGALTQDLRLTARRPSCACGSTAKARGPQTCRL